MSKREITQEQLEDAARLKALVLASGMSQQQIADKLGITQPGVNHYTAGTRALNIEAVIGFSTILRVPVSEISPSTQQKIDSAYRQNPNLGTDVADLSKLDPKIRADIEKAIAMLIKGAIKDS